MLEGYLCALEMAPLITPIMVTTSMIVHTGTFEEEPVYHDNAQSDGLGIYDRMDGF